MSLFPIFKVNKLIDKDETEVIYVFYGSYFSKYDDEDKINDIIIELNSGFKKNPYNKKFNGIFNDYELENIIKNKTTVKFVNETIHLDDNIGVIKLKVFEAISKEASMSEIYLYCLKNEKLNPITVYQNLTQNDRVPLTRVRLDQLLLNLYDNNGILMNFDDFPNKMQYTFDDIINLKLNESTYLVGKAIGQKFVFSNEYPFISDPFLVKEDDLLEKSTRDMSTLNTNLLLDSGKIFNNTIYLCLAKDVFEIAEINDISTEYATKIYYPFLYKDQIDTLEELNDKRNSLISNTSEKLSEDTKQNFKNINMFYNIFQQQKQSSLFSKNTQQTGIKSLKVIIYPQFKVKIPIDIIFKLIHATQEFPLIKYNPETRQENIYRLFAPELSLDGRKIPYLEKAKINKLMTTIGKTRSVAVYTNIQYNETTIYMCCEFEDNGNINVYPLVDFNTPILLTDGENKFEEIDQVIKHTVNPLIEQIKPFFEQSGLEIPLFESIQSINVEVRDMNYHTVYNITSGIDITKYIGCISSVFTIETTNNNQAIKMRYKRVSNFNKRDSLEAFVIEKMDQGLTLNEIIKELLKQFGDLVEDENEAVELIAKISNELEVIRGANRRRSLMIQINPGFQTIMKINNEIMKTHTELIIDVTGINNIYYLDTIPIYIDTIVRITQDISSTKIKKSLINSYCKGTEIKEPVFEKITAQSEQKIQNNVVPFRDEDNVTQNRDEDITQNRDEDNEKQLQNAESMLAFLGQYDESSEELEGGEGSSSEVRDETLSNSEVSADEKKLGIEKQENIVLESDSEDIIIPKKKSKQKYIKTVAKDLENTVQGITEMPLTYPNPFSTRLEQRMPQLFVTSKDSKMQKYSRMCPFNLEVRRQPIILTKEEKDEMLKENPGELDEEADFIEYGADSKDSSKKFYYTCPKYWCLLTNKMVTEKDILDGKCSPKGSPKVNKIEDAIIPKWEKTVPKGKYVFQFYDDEEPRYPGFHKNETPSGLCIPCCYKKWDTERMITRRNICQGTPDKKTAEPSSEKEREINDQLRRKVAEEEYNEKYIKGPDRYGPNLGEHRWGFLPIVIQHFLREVNENCLISKTNPALKQNHMCILRHGVQVSSTQSFIACIASAMFYPERDVPTIKEMKNILIDSIDLDKFIKLQNGDLITSFSNPDINVKIDDYKDTKLYNKMINSIKENTKTNIRKTKTVIPSSIAAKQFVTKVAQSFENFKNFLRDDKITIDHTYLWDLVSIPNPKLFPKGINLIILQIPEDDPTNNVELLCPTNHYSDNVYDGKKDSLILIKRQNYFEPVYGYNDNGKTKYITTMFREDMNKLPKSLYSFFTKIIRPTLGEKCKAFMSKPNEYKFKQADLLDVLIKKLQDKNYTVTKQILNFQGKVIGVLAKNDKGLEGFIPCYPSSLTLLKNKGCNGEDCEYDYVYMNDDIWKSYDETLEFLKHYYKKSKIIKSDNCYDPNNFCRVSEDGVITGFLTNTNQFILIKDPIPITEVDDSIKTITSNNMLVADINTLTNNNVDNKRAEFIKRIQLETNFYNVFRNTIRILFNDYTNNNKRKKIKKECDRRYSLYKTQLDTVIDLLRDLVDDTIIFASDINYIEIDNKDIRTCVSKLNDKCEKKGSVCRFTNNKCQLVLPKINLINGTDNEIYYYGKMADELIRYNRIKSFVFKPQSYLSFGQIKYNLRDDEIIVLQDLLNNEFFENLEPSDINKFAKFNTYDTAKPILTQMYNNEQELDNDLEDKPASIPKEDVQISEKKDVPMSEKEDVPILAKEPISIPKEISIKKCPPDKKLNPKTNRCNKKCEPGFVRDSNFKCIKSPIILDYDEEDENEPIKETPKKETPKDTPKETPKKETPKKHCPPDKELNPRTNRCNKKCEPGFVRDSNFKCIKSPIILDYDEEHEDEPMKDIPIKEVTPKDTPKEDIQMKECPPDKELNPKTNRCNKKCEPGFVRDSNFKCSKKNKVNTSGTKKNKKTLLLES